MSEEIVRRLKRLHEKSTFTSLIEKEEDEKDNYDEPDDSEELEEEPEELEEPEKPDDDSDSDDEDMDALRSRASMSSHMTPSGGSSDVGVSPSNSPDEAASSAPTPPKKREFPEAQKSANPLDNQYATKFKIGDKIVLTYSNGTNSDKHATVEGYDKDGFYRIRWSDGMNTNGFTDIALSGMAKEINESKCICGGKEFITEGSITVCDKCGRQIKETGDPLTLADKSRPKGKKMIRSEAHPVSTSIKPNISETIKNDLKRSMKESAYEDGDEEDEEYTRYPKFPAVKVNGPFYKLLELYGEFWTRLHELVADIESLGYEVLEYTTEYVDVVPDGVEDDDDNEELYLPISGTSRTLILDFDRAKLL